MKLETVALFLLLLLIFVFAGWYLFKQDIDKFLSSEPTVVHIPEIPPETRSHPKSSPHIPIPPRHPVPVPPNPAVTTETPPTVLPFPTDLDDADSYLQKRLAQLISNRKLLALLDLRYFIQKLVVIIDHLPEKEIPRQHLPITPPEPGFITVGSGDQQIISKRNAARYLPYVKLIEAIPDKLLLQLYQGLYPLFQQAYREASDSGGYFNDRLIEVIDHLLQTPEPPGPIQVVRHVRRFRYSDDLLESRSAGQKILLRMGVENARRIKMKLQHLRQGLVPEG